MSAGVACTQCEHCGYVDVYDAIAGTGCLWKRDLLVNVSIKHYDKFCQYIVTKVCFMGQLQRQFHDC